MGEKYKDLSVDEPSILVFFNRVDALVREKGFHTAIHPDSNYTVLDILCGDNEIAFVDGYSGNVCGHPVEGFWELCEDVEAIRLSIPFENSEEIVYPCVAKISGVNNIDTDRMMEFDNLIEEKYNQICLDFEQIIKEPQVAGYKEILEKLGYMDTTPAGMRLLTSFKEKGFKHINYLVDAYNIVSMQYCAGIGMHDAALLGDVIEIRVADGTETIRPMFQAKEKKIKKGDLIYTSNGTTVAWLGKKLAAGYLAVVCLA